MYSISVGQVLDDLGGEKPDDPPSNLVMIRSRRPFSIPATSSSHPIAASYELPDAIDLFIQSGRTIDAIRLDGWRIDMGYPEDRDCAAEWLKGQDSEVESDHGESDAEDTETEREATERAN